MGEESGEWVWGMVMTKGVAEGSHEAITADKLPLAVTVSCLFLPVEAD